MAPRLTLLLAAFAGFVVLAIAAAALAMAAAKDRKLRQRIDAARDKLPEPAARPTEELRAVPARAIAASSPSPAWVQITIRSRESGRPFSSAVR